MLVFDRLAENLIEIAAVQANIVKLTIAQLAKSIACGAGVVPGGKCACKGADDSSQACAKTDAIGDRAG